MKTRMFYAFSFENDELEGWLTYYLEVNLPFVPPVGATVWIPSNTDGGLTVVGPTVIDHEHMTDEHRYYIDIRLGKDGRNGDVKSLGGSAKLCEVLEFHGWKTNTRNP